MPDRLGLSGEEASETAMHNLGYILKSAREDRDLTQTEVMRRTGINNKTLSGYENNIAEPDLTTFAQLMELYQLSADQVLGTGSAGSFVTASEQELIELYRRLPKKRRREVLEILRLITRSRSPGDE
ncbi:helix-turn-helix domain-containing protein [Anaerotruncus colihominis]|nr:helix-turn-helix domain-containing protein [Anaerotruncus colihominis]